MMKEIRPTGHGNQPDSESEELQTKPNDFHFELSYEEKQKKSHFEAVRCLVDCSKKSYWKQMISMRNQLVIHYLTMPFILIKSIKSSDNQSSPSPPVQKMVGEHDFSRFPIQKHLVR
jgi:hypothetical protein